MPSETELRAMIVIAIAVIIAVFSSITATVYFQNQCAAAYAQSTRSAEEIKTICKL